MLKTPTTVSSGPKNDVWWPFLCGKLYLYTSTCTSPDQNPLMQQDPITAKLCDHLDFLSEPVSVGLLNICSKNGKINGNINQVC